VDPGEVGLVGQPARHRAGGDHQPVVGHLAPVGAHDPPLEVEAGRPDPEPEVGPELLVGLASQGHRVAVGGAGEEGLRQRRAVVGEVGLGPEHGQRAGEPEPTQLLGRPQPGQRRADDDDPVDPFDRVGRPLGDDGGCGHARTVPPGEWPET
jgi:hypothetical protein